MKKVLSIVLVTLMLAGNCIIASATPVGTVIGEALHTDIVVYINNYAIPSYAANGQSVIVAEDLRNFGFNVVWNQSTRSLKISKGLRVLKPENIKVIKDKLTGTKFTDILATDISVYADSKKITSYAMNGYTMIPVEELTMFGTVTWNDADRALYLKVDPNKKLTREEACNELKNYILKKGVKMYGKPYIVIVPTEEGYSCSFSYNEEDDTLNILYQVGDTTSLLVTLNNAKVPQVYFDCFGKYKILAEYKNKNRPYVYLYGTVPEFLETKIFELLDIDLKIVSLYLEENVGISFTDLEMGLNEVK